MLELAVLPAGAVVLTLAVYKLCASMAADEGLASIGGAFIAVLFGALVGGSLWSDDAAHHATALLPTLGIAAALGIRAGLRNRRRPVF